MFSRVEKFIFGQDMLFVFDSSPRHHLRKILPLMEQQSVHEVRYHSAMMRRMLISIRPLTKRCMYLRMARQPTQILVPRARAQFHYIIILVCSIKILSVQKICYVNSTVKIKEIWPRYISFSIIMFDNGVNEVLS